MMHSAHIRRPQSQWLLKLGLLCMLVLSTTMRHPVFAQAGGDIANPYGDDSAAASSDGDNDTKQAPDADNTYDANQPAPAGPFIPHTLCEGRIIKRIKVQGQRRVAEEDILASLELSAGQACKDESVAQEVRSLWNLGFFDNIAVDAHEVDASKVELTFVVHERPAIGKIEFHGNNELEKSDLEEKLSLDVGSILSVPKVQRQLTRIRDLYAEKGYYLAKVTFHLFKMPEDEVLVRFEIEEGEAVSVRHIRFRGNRTITDEELKSAMQTQGTGFFSFLSSSDNFKKQQIEDDVTRLQVVYYDKGFLNVNVSEPHIEFSADQRYIDVSVAIKEGPRYRVRKVRVYEVNERGERVPVIGSEAELRKKVSLKRGDWFSRSTIGKDLLDIRTQYRDKGYAKVQIEPRPQLDDKNRLVDVDLVIQRGPLVRIERINIAGNSVTRDSVIRREIAIDEGDWYNQTLLERSKYRVNALGFFERVDVSETEGSKPNTLVLNFEVAERSTGQFQLGAGFSSFESFIFTSQVMQQNLFGRGQSLSLQLQLSGIRQLMQVSFIEPWLFDTRWTLGVDAYKTLRQFQAFARDSTGGEISLGHPIHWDELRVFLQYRFEDVKISGRSGGFFGATGGGRGFNVFQRLPLANLFRSGVTSALRFTVSWDSRNNRLFPSDGVYTSASTELAESILGSTNTFVRNRVFARVYKELFAGFVFKMNTEWGLITSTQSQGVPIFERFFLGGIFNVRGFPFFSLGPRVGIPGTTDPNGNVADQGITIGGNMQAFYNIELEFPILSAVGIRGVVFTDGGNTWNTEQLLCQAPPGPLGDNTTDPCRHNLLDIRTSWGFGLRWISPLGPLRFEWGLPFARRSYERPILFEFTIGNFF